MTEPIKTWMDVREAAKALIEEARRAGVGDRDIMDALLTADDHIHECFQEYYSDFVEPD